eukprot:1158533-Pelagomonas_calceolata.AAC.9
MRGPAVAHASAEQAGNQTNGTERKIVQDGLRHDPDHDEGKAGRKSHSMHMEGQGRLRHAGERGRSKHRELVARAEVRGQAAGRVG